MKAFVLEDRNRAKLVNSPEPKLERPTDAIVNTTLTTICGSDIHLSHGQIPSEPPHPLGHECVGVVAEVGELVSRFSVGDRVAVAGAPWCGTCDSCLACQIQACLRGANRCC